MKIKVKNLLPNPFRNIDAYPIDQEKIRQLRNSIRETTFWDNILARPAPEDGNKYEIAYGHHRLVAIKEELGEEIIVDIPVRDLPDEEMLKIMANENMQEWSTDWRVVVETVKAAQKFLVNHPKILWKYKDPTKRKDIGAGAIAKFLGSNWYKDKVREAIAVIRNEEIVLRIKPRNEKQLDLKSMQIFTSIEDTEAKRKWVDILNKKDVAQAEMQEIARFENDPTLTSQDKETLRSLIQQDELRGKEQISRRYQVYRVQRLTMPKTSRERERKKQQLEEHLLEIAKQGIHLAELISTLAGQISSHPETLELFPLEETAKANSAMHDLVRAIRDYKEKYDMARSKMKDNKALEGAIVGERESDIK